MGNQVDYEKIEKAAKNRKKLVNGITYFLLTIWGIIVLFPFYWMVLTSIKSLKDIQAILDAPDFDRNRILAFPALRPC